MSRTQPNGRVLGVDIIPAQPPKGVSTIQGNFLAPEIQEYIREWLRSPQRGRLRLPDGLDDTGDSLLERGAAMDTVQTDPSDPSTSEKRQDRILQRTVDVVLSDMSAPWHQTSGFWKRSLSNPYNRMMNTSGNNFRDHAGSMVCAAANLPTNQISRAEFRYRTYAMQLCALAQMSLKPEGTLSANSTKGQRIRNWRTNSRTCFTRFIDSSLSHLAV